MNNFPAMTEEQRQALIAECEADISCARTLVIAAINVNDGETKSKWESQLLRQQIALAALTTEPVAWVVMAPHGDYIENNPDCVANIEASGCAKCKPLYTSPAAQLLRPVELPEPYDDGHGNLWLPQDAVISAVKNAGGEVKS